VPAGTYRVRILGKAPAWDNNQQGLAPSWHNAQTRCEDATDVVVTVDATIDLVAPPTVQVTGGVSSFHSAVTQGEVRFYSRCADYAWDEQHGNSYRASAKAIMDNGVYTVLVAAGTYRVYVNPFGPETSLPSWHSAANTCEKATEVVVTGNSTVPLTVRGTGNVTGTARIGKAPVAQGSVTFYTDCEAARTGQGSAMAWFTGGTFTVTVPDGSYLVKIGSTVARDSWHRAADGCASATPVVVSGRTSLDLVGKSAAQSVKRPPKKLARGKRVALARKTDRLIQLHWKSLTKRVCTVRKYTLRGVRKGKCRVSVETWTVLGLDTLSRKFTIRVV
jgi:hypothetical protein